MLKKEISGYVIVGTIGASVDFGIFNILVQSGSTELLANLASVTLAGIGVFFGNLLLSFRHVAVTSRAFAAKRFLALTILTIVCNSFLVGLGLAIFVEANLLEANLIKASVVGILTIGRFLALKFLIFTAQSN
jgi:putative flippase GtrA